MEIRETEEWFACKYGEYVESGALHASVIHY